LQYFSLLAKLTTAGGFLQKVPWAPIKVLFLLSREYVEPMLTEIGQHHPIFRSSASRHGHGFVDSFLSCVEVSQ
jgi:hypothetical protein